MGVTATLLKVAGYSKDVAGDHPAHLSCWSNHLGRSVATVGEVAEPASDPSVRKLPRFIQLQGLSVSISVSGSLQIKHEQRKAKEADTANKQARRKAKKVKRQASKQQSGQQQASPPQLTRPEPADSQPVVEQQEVVPNDEPWLEAIIPLPWGFSFPTVLGSPAALARLQFAPSSTAEGLGTPLPVASSPRADMPDAASPRLAREGALSLCQMLSPLGRRRLHPLIGRPWWP